MLPQLFNKTGSNRNVSGQKNIFLRQQRTGNLKGELGDASDLFRDRGKNLP